jgi:hypothetical protein
VGDCSPYPDPPHCLRGQMHYPRHRRRDQADRQLLQGKGSQDNTHLLNAASQKVPKLLLIFRRYFHLKGAARHAPV